MTPPPTDFLTEPRPAPAASPRTAATSSSLSSPPSPSAAPPTTPATAGDPPQRIAAQLEDLIGGRVAQHPWRRRLALAAAVLLVAAGAGAWWHARHLGADAPRYRTEPVTRGDLAVRVVANGTLQPTRSVSIGSELSGTVSRVTVDVNDRVARGQVLVELDAAKLRDQVQRSRAAWAQAEAKVAQADATTAEAQAALARQEEVARLSGGRLPSRADLDTARATLARARADAAGARAGVDDARAALRTDETNLSKASIRSPIDGVVLTRAVDPGNAVAASLQAVTLFTLAEDLRRLELRVNVDEADVGAVAAGQEAGFTVSAYPNRSYPARVTRVAYASTTTDNVVTFQTTLQVANDDLSLRPGMTATTTIATQQRRGVLRVPNAALRFTPAPDPTAAAGAGDASRAAGPHPTGAPPGSAAGPAKPGGLLPSLIPRPPDTQRKRPAGETAGPAAGTPASHRVWVLRGGRAEPVAVVAGVSDGRLTEVQGDGLAEGDAVIVDQQAAPR